MQRQSPILILGLGNELLCDDAIGIRLVTEFEELYKSAGTHFLTSSNGGLEIIELISGYEQVIIIDAIKTQNGVPGSIYHFSPADFKNTLHVSSFHDISFLTALKFGDYMNIKIPKDIHIIAIEIVEDLLFSNEFSKPIKKKYNIIKKQIKNYIDQLLNNNNTENYNRKFKSEGSNIYDQLNYSNTMH